MPANMPTHTESAALAVDGVWAYTGTGNFDNLSLRHNRELGLTVVDGPLIRELEERVFLPDPAHHGPAYALAGHQASQRCKQPFLALQRRAQPSGDENRLQQQRRAVRQT